MKILNKVLIIIGLIIISIFFIALTSYAANVFPTTLNDWEADDTIESDWADSLEIKIGVDSSTVSTSIDYLIKSTKSKLGSIYNVATTTGNFLYASGGIWTALGTIDISTHTNLAISGTLINLTGDTISINEGTLTNGKGCRYVSGTGIACDQTYLTSVSYSDLTGYPADVIIAGTNISWSASTTLNLDTLYVADVSNLATADTGITSVGTLATGTWQGTPIADAYIPDNITITDNATSGSDLSIFVGTLNFASTTGDVAFSRVSGTLNIASTTGTLGISQGGTNLTSFNLGDLIVATGANTLSALATGTEGYSLTIESGVPAWTILTASDISNLTTVDTGITSVGTLATGTYQGTAIEITYLASSTHISNAYDWAFIYNSSSTNYNLGYIWASTYNSSSTNYNTAYTFSQTIVPTTMGGSGQNWGSVATGSIPYFDGIGTMTTLGGATSTYVLSTQGVNTVPVWVVAGAGDMTKAVYDTGANDAVDVTAGGTNLTSFNLGDLIVATGADTLAALATGTENYALTISGGVPAWTDEYIRITGDTMTGALTITDNLTASGTITFSDIVGGFLKVGATGIVTTSTIDISDNTNLTCGDYCTKTDDDLDIDSEVVEKTASINFFDATTTAKHQPQFGLRNAVTLLRVSCHSIGGTATLNLLERSEDVPYTGGTTTLSASIVCLENMTASTTSFNDSGIASVSDIVASTTAVSAQNVNTFLKIEYRIND